ncbi:MAG: SusD/RagB family nutrient-binding outer membrane lipoprotein [Bacteroidales bacterium]|jgi:hypothetical protein|nr:SusD/RagB family nutrient-binding outer membrane lipoprotein [Bacteroidales bacterium]
MKKKICIALIALFCGTGYYGCTDKFEEINTNPHKSYDTDFKYVFPGTVLKTMRLIGELNYTHLLNNSRMVTILFNVGSVEDTSDAFYNQAYRDILRDLHAVEVDYEGKDGYQNRLAMAKTWEAYVFYILVSLYGPIPMSDALLDLTENKSSFKYDSEAQVYTRILELLKEAGDLYQPNSQYSSTDCLKPDFVFNLTQSDIRKWQRFTNTLRLNVAMHAQSLLPELAQEHAAAVFSDESLLISSNGDNVAPRYGNDISINDVSYYYNRFLKAIDANGTWGKTTFPIMSEYFALYLFSYKDPRIETYFTQSNEGSPASISAFQFTDTITSIHRCERSGTYKCNDYAEHQDDHLNDYRRDSVLVDYSVPYVPVKEVLNLPDNWEIALKPGSTSVRYDDPLNTSDDNNLSRVKRRDYLETNAVVVLYNYADACFLKAEAKIKFGLGSKSAEKYYKEGVEAAFEYCGIKTQAAAYLAQPGIAWNTDGQGYYDRMGFYSADIHGAGGDENHLEQIYKQRTFGCFFNGLEAWNLERRTRAFRWPPIFMSNMSVEGMVSPDYSFGRERLNYPLVEMTRNGDEYYRAIQLLQAASPNGNPAARWGDNTVTALAFTKVDPEIAVAESKYGGYRQIVYHAAYFSHYWGTTYEELLAKALAMTGETSDSRALTKAFNYKYGQRLSTYYWQEPPMPEPEE